MDRIYSEMTSLQYENRALRKEIESFRNGERYKKLQQDHHQVIAGYERKISQLKKDLENERATRKRVRNLWIDQCKKDYDSYQAELEVKNRKMEKLEKEKLEIRKKYEETIASLIQNYEEKLEEKQNVMNRFAANEIQIISGSDSIAKIRSGEIAAAMILEESVLKALKDAEDQGVPLTNLACIYPEDGVILIPSTVMTVSDAHSKNANAEACKAVEQWFLSEPAQKLILNGYMHSVFANMNQIPYGSVDTEELIAKDMGVNWENVYHSREEINLAWMDIVANRLN